MAATDAGPPAVHHKIGDGKRKFSIVNRQLKIAN
jgi:hypothetical protein